MTGWSWLNETGKRYQILPDSNCPVCKRLETVKHYLLECSTFADHREIPKRKLDYPFTEKTLFGLRNLTLKQLYSIFLSLYDYISHRITCSSGDLVDNKSIGLDRLLAALLLEVLVGG